MSETGDLVIPKEYTVETRLGEGGMGAVFLIRDRFVGFPIALKCSHKTGERARKQMLLEALSWIDLVPHPNVAKCYFIREYLDQVYIFSEYVNGGTLGHWINAKRLNTTEKILELAFCIADALDHIHEQGLVHQDVKPANILMTDAGIPKLSDFGLARVRSHTAGQAIAAGYTPQYSSPEQTSGGVVTRATDMWAWALVVIEMFCGEAFWASGLVAPELVTGLASGEIPTLCPLPQALAGILSRCVGTEPRWASMADVMCTMQTALADYTSAFRVPISSKLVRTDATTVSTSSERPWLPPEHWFEKHRVMFANVPAPSRNAGTSSVRALALADLLQYQDWLGSPPQWSRIQSKAATNSIDELDTAYVEISLTLAKLYNALDDHSTALRIIDEALAHVAQQGEPFATTVMATTVGLTLAKVIALVRLGNVRLADALSFWSLQHATSEKQRREAIVVAAEHGLRGRIRELTNATRDLIGKQPGDVHDASEIAMLFVLQARQRAKLGGAAPHVDQFSDVEWRVARGLQYAQQILIPFLNHGAALSPLVSVLIERELLCEHLPDNERVQLVFELLQVVDLVPFGLLDRSSQEKVLRLRMFRASLEPANEASDSQWLSAIRTELTNIAELGNFQLLVHVIRAICDGAARRYPGAETRVELLTLGLDVLRGAPDLPAQWKWELELRILYLQSLLATNDARAKSERNELAGRVEALAGRMLPEELTLFAQALRL